MEDVRQAEEVKRLQVDIEAELFAELKRLAEERGLKFHALIARVLRAGLIKEKTWR